jgi:RNA polymerase sigma-70 factor (ECF subfamily)
MTTLAPEILRESERCYELGTSRYPEIRWDFPDFARVWSERIPPGESFAASEDEFVRLACLEDRPNAIAVFERDYIAALRASVQRVCTTEEATDAALQEVRTKLLLPPSPRLASYRPSGSFRAWLKVLAVRTALDVARKLGARAQREVELEERLQEFATGPEEQLMNEELRNILRVALRAAVKKLPEEQQQALKLHLVSGWNIGQIGRVLSVHRATVARWLVTAKERLGDLLRQELAASLGASSREVSVVLENLPSRLDLSLSRMFATTGVYACA